MAKFLLWIGAYNILGSLLLMAMHHQGVADFVLRRLTEVISDPYQHLGFSRLFLWWAAMTNLFLGVVMVRAGFWPVEIQREVALFAIGVYFIGWLCVVFGLRRPRYGRGIYALHPLWLIQIGWGAWSSWQSLH